MKRKRTAEELDEASSSTKTRSHAAESEPRGDALQEVQTPTKRGRGRPRKSQIVTPVKADSISNEAVNGFPNGEATPKSHRKVLFTIPNKPEDESQVHAKSSIVHNADRSARRKSARALIERTISDDIDGEALDEEDELVQDILSADEGEEDEEADDTINIDQADLDQLPETPSKRGRGRPKGRRKVRSPTPPTNLPPHERYFFDNRPGGIKTSNNTLSSLSLLTHEEYFEHIQAYKDPHKGEQEFLHSLHSRSFEQWAFELNQGFNICLYGYGSKRALALDFATYLSTDPTPFSSTCPKIIVVNGYNPSTTLRSVFTTLGSVVFPKNTKLPTQPTDLLALIQSYLSDHPPQTPILLLIHNLDSPSLRTTRTISALSALISTCHPHISLLATVDTPSFPLLFSLPHLSSSGFRFLFHDCTTFAPWSEGEEISTVDTVNELLGRQGRRAIGGREGVGFVLRSLPENARNLFRVLVAEQLAALESDPAPNAVDTVDDEDMEGAAASGIGHGKSNRQRGPQEGQGAVEYRTLYQKASEEFICSNEIAFRQLLKEFHDHQMVCSRRDGFGGGEVLWVPFRKEELEALLEDIVE